MLTNRAIPLPLCLPLLLATSAAAQTTVTLQPTADTTIYRTTLSTELGNGAGQFAVMGNTGVGANETRRALWRFDIANRIPSGAAIQSVQLSLQIEKIPNGFSFAHLHRVTSDWGEGAANADAGPGQGAAAQPGDATWLSAFFPGTPWSTPGGDFAGQPSATQAMVLNPQGSPRVLMWDSSNNPGMVTDVQQWLSQPATDFGWLSRTDESVAATAMSLYTREGQNFEPQLTITYTPPAGAAQLAPFGAACSSGSLAEIDLQGSGAPVLGASVTLRMRGGPAPAFGLLVLSPTRLNTPGDFSGCPVWLDTTAPLTILVSGSIREVTAAVPANSALAGLTLHAQGIEFVATTFQTVTSNGLTGVVGN